MFTGKQLKEKRVKDNLSATQLGKLIGATRESIYKWEGGKIKPRDPNVTVKIEKWLKGTLPVNDIPVVTPAIKKSKVIKQTNGVDWQGKYYDLLEKYTALLEKSI